MRRPDRAVAVSSLMLSVLLLSTAAAPAVAEPGGEVLRSLVDAERSFAHAAADESTRAAFLRYLAPDGIVFAPGPVAGRPLWDARQERPSLLGWEPEEVAVSAAGDLGYTFGPWEFRAARDATEPDAAGHYISVWRRSGDEPWRVAVDIGVTHDAVAPGALTVAPAGLAAGTEDPDAAAAAAPTLVAALAADAAFAAAWGHGGPAAAYGGWAAGDLCAFRSAARPARGRDAAIERIGAEPAPGAVAGSGIAASGDLAYVYGASGDRPDSAFLRVWRRTADGWRLAVDVAEPIDASASSAFDRDFTGATMRVDLYHSGTATAERIALDRVRIEGPWPGSRTRLLDDSNLGKYLVEVVDLSTNLTLFSHGFDDIYGEWAETPEAVAGTWRTIEEAVRVPEPRRPVQLRLRKRDAHAAFVELWTTVIDPASRFVDRAPVPPADVWTIAEHGDPSVKVDLLVLGDGYAAEEMERFHDDARTLTDALFEAEPFRSRRDDFNVRAIDTPAAQSGISRPRAGVFRGSPLGARYNTFDAERYVMTLRDRAWRDVAAAAPYDVVLILVNDRKYGGGGIYGLYSTAAARSSYATYLVIHEFGHHFAGLGDEYYTSPDVFEHPEGELPEPVAPNVTALHDPEHLKWADLATEGVPVPTPWNKQEYDRRSREIQARRAELRAAGAAEEELEKLFDEERAEMTQLLGDERYAGAVGAFEGAQYQPQGLYRPSADCIMFTRDDVGFCAVCRRAIERAIDRLTR